MNKPSPYHVPTPAPILLYLLTRERLTIEKLAQLGKSYEPLLRYLLDQSPEAKQPTGKTLQEVLGISPSVYRRWLDAWDEDFWELAQAESTGFLAFTSVEHIIQHTHRERGFWFRCQLAVTPRVGEGIELPFVIKQYMRNFYVDSVEHTFQNGRTEIVIEVREGRYNLHLQKLRHRARFERELWHGNYEDDTYLADYFRELAKPSMPTQPAQVIPQGHGRYKR